MEKLTFSPNGQWTLSKAIPDPEFHDYGYGYALDLTHPSGQYSGKHLENIQNTAVKEATPFNKVKHMTNNETGKMEPHVLVHYGMTNYKDQGRKKGKDSRWNNFNQFKLSGDHVHVTGDQGAVASQDPEYSHEFATAGNSETNGSGDSRLMSFWVPKSKIASYASHKEPYHSVLGEDKYVDPDVNYLSRQKNSQEYDPELEDESEDKLEDQYMADQPMDFGHTRIHPGKYTPATWKEIENASNFRDKDIVDKIKHLHHHTHGFDKD